MEADSCPALGRAVSFRLPDNSVYEDEAGEDAVLESSEAGSRPQRSGAAGLPESTLSLYSKPVSAEHAAEICPPSSAGLIYHATIISDEAEDKGDASNRRGKYEVKFNEDGTVRPRRGPPLVRTRDFFSSLVQTADGRWIFSGVLNGWPALTCFELRSVTSRVSGGLTVGFQRKIERVWDAKHDCGVGSGSRRPEYPIGHHSVRVTLRAPAWSAVGYTPGTPGFVWWFFQTRDPPSLAHGAEILIALVEKGQPEAVATRVHLFAHRYAMLHESAKDRILYHAAILLEWSHGKHATVIELATLNGVGGRMGRMNWCEDKGAAYSHMPAQMIAPWKGELAEIRCCDVKARNLDEFRSFMAQHTGADKRFLDPQFPLSAPVRLSHRSQKDVAGYLLNYMGRDRRYTEKVRNCQAFAADFFGFAAGKKGIEPVMAVLRPLYTPRAHLFLYDADLYNNPVPEAEGEEEAVAVEAESKDEFGGD